MKLRNLKRVRNATRAECPILRMPKAIDALVSELEKLHRWSERVDSRLNGMWREFARPKTKGERGRAALVDLLPLILQLVSERFDGLEDRLMSLEHNDMERRSRLNNKPCKGK